MQDIESKKEINSLLNAYKIKSSTKVADPSISRIRKIFSENNDHNKITIKSRSLTFFTHANLNELFIMINRLLINKKYNYLYKDKLFYIRCHPVISEKLAKEKLKRFLKNNNFNSYNFRFIENSKESIIESMLKSKSCIFGESSYINLAAKLGLNVIVIRTSFFYDPPIQDQYKNIENLMII